MADTVITTRPTNGVSYSYRHTVTAADLTKAGLLFDFGVDHPISAIITYLSNTGVVTALTNASVSFPANGQVRLYDFVKDALMAATIELRATYAAHIADDAEHILADTVNDLTALPVTTVAEMYTALGELFVAYQAHDADVDDVTPTYHQATSTLSQLTSTATPATIAQAVTRVNDFITKYTAHDANATSHDVGGQYPPASVAVAGTEFVFTQGSIVEVVAQRARVS